MPTIEPHESQSIEPKYIGDGVYASFDGFQIWLTVGHHEAAPLVALEPQAFAGLLRYAKAINQLAKRRYFDVD